MNLEHVQAITNEAETILEALQAHMFADCKGFQYSESDSALTVSDIVISTAVDFRRSRNWRRVVNAATNVLLDYVLERRNVSDSKVRLATQIVDKANEFRRRLT